MTSEPQTMPAPSIAESLKEYGRGLAGGFLFSMPLLFTMEVWWAGVNATPARLLAGLAATFALLCAYNAYAGLRFDSGALAIAIDSVEELGLGLLTSAGALWLLGRLTSGLSPSAALGQIVVEGLLVAVGVSVGTAQLGGNSKEQSTSDSDRHTIGSELVLALCGTMLIATNVGATEEIVVLAMEVATWHLLAIMAVSLAIAALLLFNTDFVGSDRFAGGTRLDVVLGCALTYAVALFGSACLLWFFGRYDSVGLELAASQTVVLALPGTLGAAAGRLLLR